MFLKCFLTFGHFEPHVSLKCVLKKKNFRYMVQNSYITCGQITKLSGSNVLLHTRFFLFKKHTFKKHEAQNVKKLRNI